MTLLAAAFNSDPLGPNVQPGNSSGTAFRLSDGVFAIGEAQYQLDLGPTAGGVIGIYKLGGWYSSELSNAKHSGNWSV